MTRRVLAVLALVLPIVVITGPAEASTFQAKGDKDLLLCGPGKRDVGQGGPGKDKLEKCEKGNP